MTFNTSTLNSRRSSTQFEFEIAYNQIILPSSSFTYYYHHQHKNFNLQHSERDIIVLLKHQKMVELFLASFISVFIYFMYLIVHHIIVLKPMGYNMRWNHQRMLNNQKKNGRQLAVIHINSCINETLTCVRIMYICEQFIYIFGVLYFIS